MKHKTILILGLLLLCLCFLISGQQSAAPTRQLTPFLSLPVQQAVITEGWNYGSELEFHPKIPTHYAVDFQAPLGSPVFAAADGYALHTYHTYYLPDKYVDKNGNSHRLGYGLGHFIQIWHPKEKVFTSYSHLLSVNQSVPYVPPSEHDGLYITDVVYKPLEEMLKYCKLVKQGQFIGMVGDTGLSDNYEENPRVLPETDKLKTWDPAGPHLHFEVYARNAQGQKDRSQRWDPYGIYGKTKDYHSGKPAAMDNLWLLDEHGFPRAPKMEHRIVKRGEGLIPYLDPVEAIEFAKKNDLKIYLGSVRITSERALAEVRKGSRQIKVLVHPGDLIDKTFHSYNSVSRHYRPVMNHVWSQHGDVEEIGVVTGK